MCRRGTCACRPASASSGAGALSLTVKAVGGTGLLIAAGCVLCWRWFTGARLLAELPTDKPRALARHVHATLRTAGTVVTAGLFWDWRITLAATVLTLAGLTAAGLTYRHRTRPVAREQIIYAGRGYTAPRPEIGRNR